MSHTQTITLYQPLLQSIAMKMVGSMADAEDIVQDTFLKWLTIDAQQVRNTKAYLIKTVTNKCINHLDTLKRKKDDCLSNLKASDLIDKYKEKEFFKFDMENELAAAWSILHKKLEPLERGIYVLREFFDFEYDELQHVFDKKKDNCRQLFSRAKNKLAEGTDKIRTEWAKSHCIESFKKACTGNPSDFIMDVKKEIISRTKNN